MSQGVLILYVPFLRYTRRLGWRIHCGVEVTESSTNKQHIIKYVLRRLDMFHLHCYNIVEFKYPLPQRELVLLYPVLGPPVLEYVCPQRQLASIYITQSYHYHTGVIFRL